MCSPAVAGLNHELGTVMWECGQALLREQGLGQLKPQTHEQGSDLGTSTPGAGTVSAAAVQAFQNPGCRRNVVPHSGYARSTS